MDIKLNLKKQFDFEVISKKIFSLAQASIGVWANTYKEQTIQDVKRKKLFTVRTGTLLKSIQTIPDENSITIGVFAEYGKYLEEGTRSYIIRPKDRQALKIPISNGYIFRKSAKHPGIKPRHWFIGAFKERSQTANKEMINYFKKGLEKIQKGED